VKTTIDKFGRVVIPKPLRDELHLAPGSSLTVEHWKSEIVLKPVEDTPSVVRKDGFLIFMGEPTGDLEAAVDEIRKARALELSE